MRYHFGEPRRWNATHSLPGKIVAKSANRPICPTAIQRYQALPSGSASHGLSSRSSGQSRHTGRHSSTWEPDAWKCPPLLRCAATSVSHAVPPAASLMRLAMSSGCSVHILRLWETGSWNRKSVFHNRETHVGFQNETQEKPTLVSGDVQRMFFQSLARTLENAILDGPRRMSRTVCEVSHRASPVEPTAILP